VEAPLHFLFAKAKGLCFQSHATLAQWAHSLYNLQGWSMEMVKARHLHVVRFFLKGGGCSFVRAALGCLFWFVGSSRATVTYPFFFLLLKEEAKVRWWLLQQP